MARWSGRVLVVGCKIVRTSVWPLQTLVALTLVRSGYAQLPEGTRWAGTWTNPRGYIYVAELRVDPGPHDSLEARFHWTLLRSPRQDEQVGRSATEFARGRYDAGSQLLLLVGYRKDDPDSVIGIDSYRLLIGNRGDVLLGITDNHGTWEGRFSARRVPPNIPGRASVSSMYALYDLTNPAAGRVTTMSMTDDPAGGFHVSGQDAGGWEASGRMEGSQGYYDWRFNDGRTGRTTIVLHSDGTFRGHVVGNGEDWWYLAVPAPAPPKK